MRTGMLWFCLLTTNVAVVSVALALSRVERRVQALERWDGIPTATTCGKTPCLYGQGGEPASPWPSPVWTTCDFAEERGVPCMKAPE